MKHAYLKFLGVPKASENIIMKSAIEIASKTNWRARLAEGKEGNYLSGKEISEAKKNFLNEKIVHLRAI